MIYSQRFLLDQGLAVTWNNPDIDLFDGSGILVDSHALAPDTVYDVVARIWNGSTSAPAVNLPVRFSYNDFGVGPAPVVIGETTVDLAVKGAPGCPAFAHQAWRTPSTPGHYCIKVELLWPDDANPANNLGQENTDVKKLNSPHAAFAFPVRNDAGRRQVLRLQVDAYQIPARRRCGPAEAGTSPDMDEQELEEHRRHVIASHHRGAHPVPPGWSVVVVPEEMVLAPDEQRQVTVDITAPDGFAGRQSFNVNAFERTTLVGGVTLTVEGD